MRSSADFLLFFSFFFFSLGFSRKAQDYDPKVEALKRAREIWSRLADRSREAAHASRVLDHILSSVPSSSQGENTAQPTQSQEPSGSLANAASDPANEGSDQSNAPNSPRRENRAVPTSTQANSPSLRSAANKLPTWARPAVGRTQDWEFGKWDEMDRRASRGSGRSLEGASALDVDWVRSPLFHTRRDMIVFCTGLMMSHP